MTDTYPETAYGNTLTAFFDDREDAEDAASRLRQLGLPDSSITMTEGRSRSEADDPNQAMGFFEALGAFFFPPEDRTVYAEGLSRGGYLLTVTGLTAAMHDDAVDILDHAGAVDIDARADSWRAEGWSGIGRETSTATGAGLAAGAGMGAAATGILANPTRPDALTDDQRMSMSRDGSLTAIDSDLAESRRNTRSTDIGLGEGGLGVGASGEARRSETDNESLPDRDLDGEQRPVSGGHGRVRSYAMEQPSSADAEPRRHRVQIVQRPTFER